MAERIYILERKTVLPTTLEKAWEFFSNPRNLTFITPPEMNFEIISPLKEGEFYSGMQIEYVVRPFAGIPMRWVSEITSIAERRHFHDIQLTGPYTSWKHRHEFREVPGGVQMLDIVEYQMPFGWMGRVLHRWIIRPRLEYIFNYRAQRIQFLFRMRHGQRAVSQERFTFSKS